VLVVECRDPFVTVKLVMPLKILLADKDYVFYLLLREELERLRGYECELIWCGECKEMIRAAQASVYDLVLFDYEECGVDLLRQVERAGISIPVVALTDGNHRAAVQARREGAFGCLSKENWDPEMLHHYLLCADLHRSGELYQAKTLEAGRYSAVSNTILMTTTQ